MKKQPIIIKKIKKVSGGGHSGGSWKVAYADFVTAMMAFFLLMWLLNMTSAEKRARVSTYFKHYSIFSTSGSKAVSLEKGGGVMISGEENEGPSKTAGAPAPAPPPTIDPGQGIGQGAGAGKGAAEAFKESLRSAIEAKLGDIKDQVMVDNYEGGVRIQLLDTEGKAMFDVGSPNPANIATRVLKVVGDNISNLPNQVAIEGHTDSLGYKSATYGNWELSTERALSARKVLEKFGLEPGRITKVAGYADTVPLIKEDSKDPRNRRISIILLFPEKKPL